MDIATLCLIKKYIDKANYRGSDGKSAYEIAVDNGFVGTESDWIASLQGNDINISDFHLTRESITDIVTDLYSELSAAEIEDIVDDIEDNLSEAGGDMIEEILSDNNYENDYSGGGGSINLSSYAPLASPTFTGTPTAPTAATGTNTTQIATTEFVKIAIDAAIGGIENGSY